MRYKARALLLSSLMALLFLIPTSLQGQTEEKLKEQFVEAESFFLFEEYKDALPLYQRILQADPENFNINYKVGICYLNDDYQVKKSILYLEKAARGTNPGSKTTSFKERMAPPEALYYLGIAYRSNNMLNEAIEAFQQFKQVLDPEVYDIELLEEQITACQVAEKLQAKPMYFVSLNLDEAINTRFEELYPLVSGDEKSIVFTRRLQFYDAVFYARRENGKWTEPENLTPYFGVDGNTWSTGLSFDGSELFVYRSDNFDGNLYVSRYRNGKWSKLEKLNGNINTKYWESHASVSKDGRTLYFTSNRAGGYGGLDIYKSERSRTGDWGPAINLGPVINSKYNEDTPFLTDDGNTLYFSSMGHYNMGGYDVFYSTRLAGGQWSKPINAGYPLNNTRDNQFFVPVQNGAFAYYSQYDPKDSYGLADIYKLEVFSEYHPRKFILNGVARIDGTLKPDFTKVTASLYLKKTGETIDRTRLNSDGTYTMDAISGDLELRFEGASVLPVSEMISISLNNPSNIIAHTVLLNAFQQGDTSRQTVSVVIPESDGPQMGLSATAYSVTTAQKIPIRLDLEKDTRLEVLSFLNGDLKKTENFEISRKRFVYMFTPQPGENMLRFTLTDKDGRSSIREVTVLFTLPPEMQFAGRPAGNGLESDDRYRGLETLASGNLAGYLKQLGLADRSFESISDLYDLLISQAEANNYTQAEVDALVAAFLAQKDVTHFADELKAAADDSLAALLDTLGLKRNNLYTPTMLIDYLHKATRADTGMYSSLRRTLMDISSGQRDASVFIDLLRSHSDGDLEEYLNRMRQNVLAFSDSRAAASTIFLSLAHGDFGPDALDVTLRNAAADLDVHYLYQGLLYLSADSMKDVLSKMDLKELQIVNSLSLITRLMDRSTSQGYTRGELLNQIEKLRTDPYHYIDLFRQMLASRAEGELKIFLQDIDIRGLQINTFEELVDYLLVQSQFHDFNRETVYQLLLDIINPGSVKEFINLLILFGDNRIDSALAAGSGELFSTPFEVMEYLIRVAETYRYTERDLLRLLLKIMFSSETAGTEKGDMAGWWNSIDRPGLLIALVLLNFLIIALLIIFLVRKKRKNDKQNHDTLSGSQA